MEDPNNPSRASITETIEGLIEQDRARRFPPATKPSEVPVAIGAVGIPGSLTTVVPKQVEAAGARDSASAGDASIIATRIIVGGVATDVNLFYQA